jgi:hypothetical protein
MSEQVQLRRGTTSQNAAFTGAQGELVADTTANVLVLHDGFTQGGHPIPSKAYVDTLIAGDTGNVTFSGNTVSTAGTNQNLSIVPNGTGIVHVSNLTVDGTIVGSITGSAATVTTNANLTGPITSNGNATSVATQTGTGSIFVMQAAPTLTLPNIGTPTFGNLTNCTFPTLNQDTTGSANNASYLGGVAANGYELALGYTPYNANVNANAYTTLSEVSNVGYLTSIDSGNVTTALGYTPLDSASFTGANIVSNIGANVVSTANNANYLGGILAADYLLTNGSASLLTSFPTLNQDTTGSANNASYLGGIVAAGYELALGYTPLDSVSFTGANVVVQLGYTPYDANVNANAFITAVDSISGSANNASYLGNIAAANYVTTTTLDNNTLAANVTSLYSSGNITVIGNLSVAGNITGNISSINNAVVYDYTGAVSDQAIYTGNIQLNGSAGVVVTLPAAYSNANFTIQAQYNGVGFNSGLAGWIYSNTSSSSQFTIYSSGATDTNYVFWTTFGSVN